MDDKIRLDKLLANSGYGSRKQIKKAITNKAILVNDEVVSSSSIYVHPDKDKIIYKGQKVYYSKFTYIIFNKPAGYTSVTEDNINSTIFDLLDIRLKNLNLSSAGRLDKDTEGLVVLTNDGDCIHNIISPNKKIYKTYYVELSNELTDEAILNLEKGILLITENYITKPAVIEKLSSNTCYISIMEGKYHQVKRMFKTVNNNVTYLKRISIGSLKLPTDLQLGEYIEITKDELYEAINL